MEPRMKPSKRRSVINCVHAKEERNRFARFIGYYNVFVIRISRPKLNKRIFLMSGDIRHLCTIVLTIIRVDSAVYGLKYSSLPPTRNPTGTHRLVSTILTPAASCRIRQDSFMQPKDVSAKRNLRPQGEATKLLRTTPSCSEDDHISAKDTTPVAAKERRR